MPNLKLKNTLFVTPQEGKVTHDLFCVDNEKFLDYAAKPYASSIDFCYIDPPYNTGNSFRTGFTYHDAFHKKGDGNRHKSWLVFMKPRLKKTLPLLKKTGVIAISIDDSEIHRLRVLCDEVFGEKNFVAQIVVDGGAMKNNAKLLSVTHEYLLVYAKNLPALLASGRKWRVKRDGIDILRAKEKELRKKHKTDYTTLSLELKKWMKTSPLSKRLKVFYNADAGGLYTSADLSTPNSKRFYSYPHPITGKPVKTPSRGWGMDYGQLKAMAEAGEILFFEDEKRQPMKKLYLSDTNDQVVRSIMSFPSRTSTHLLEKMLGRRSSFSNPKNLDYISHLVDLICPKDGVVLDYFAGSGTTGHAVENLNASTGATRKFILCTNNENKIYDDVTKPRLIAAVTGFWGDGSKHKFSGEGLSEFR
jgi:adenine-specific DNA-methyltransferase